MWSVTDPEFYSVLVLPGPARYAYFIKRVADRNQLWGLYSSEGWVLAVGENGITAIPVWPHERFAEGCAKDEWSIYGPHLIELSAWLDQWLPGIEQAQRLIAVFPTPTDKGIVVESTRLHSDLIEELSRIE